MPEGPTIFKLKEKLSYFIGKTIIEASGYADIDYSRLKNKKVLDVKTWGKHFFICLNNTNIEMHLRLFGSYLINKQKQGINPKLHLGFKKDELNFYVLDVHLTDSLAGFDPSSDILSDQWNASNALIKLKKNPKLEIADALLTQDIFSGVGNIIKNEALWLARIHPETQIGFLKDPQLKNIIKSVRQFSTDWLHNYGEKSFKKSWGVYQKESCKRCGNPIYYAKTGKIKWGSYWCTTEQIKLE